MIPNSTSSLKYREVIHQEEFVSAQSSAKISQITIEVRRKQFEIDLLVNVGENLAFYGYEKNLIWALSDVFLSHFEKDDPSRPGRQNVINSGLFRKCVDNSDLVAVVRHEGQIVSFSTFDFLFDDALTMLTKGTFTRRGYDRRFGLGNMLNVTFGMVAAEHCWILNSQAEFRVLGRTQHPLQVVSTNRHTDYCLCSTSPNLTIRERQLFTNLAAYFYPESLYNKQTGIAEDVYLGSGAPPLVPEIKTELEEEFSAIGAADALYFLGFLHSHQSKIYRKLRKFAEKIFDPNLDKIAAVIAMSVDDAAKTSSMKQLKIAV